MRIGFDGSCLTNRRGFGRFARHILSALGTQRGQHQFVVILDRPSEAAVTLPEGFERCVADVSQVPSEAASARGRRRLGDMLAMGRAAARARLDLIYFPATYTFFPVWSVPRVVVTMHDTLALAHPELVFPTWKGRLAWMLKEHVAARRADRIVTVSQTSRRDLQSWFRLGSDRLRVVGEGPAPIFRPEPNHPNGLALLDRLGLPRDARFLIYVGGLSPHKNLPRLIEAFAQTVAKDVYLILVGDFHDVFHTHVHDIKEAIERTGLGRRVLLPGFVPDPELVHLYSRAYALVQPSLMEGFGLPAVEAMACGTPVISSGAGSLPEVIGDAGVFFDPTCVQSMALAIDRVVASQPLRDCLSTLALARAQNYTWEKAARSLIDCFEELDPHRAADGRIRAPHIPACDRVSSQESI